MHISGSGHNAKKNPNFQVWVPRTNVFKSSLGPTNTESGWKLVNSQIYMSSPDIVLITVLQLLYVFNVIYLLVCLLTLCLPIFSFPQHILNSKSYKERNLICSVLCPWHLEEYLAHNRPSVYVGGGKKICFFTSRPLGINDHVLFDPGSLLKMLAYEYFLKVCWVNKCGSETIRKMWHKPIMTLCKIHIKTLLSELE